MRVKTNVKAGDGEEVDRARAPGGTGVVVVKVTAKFIK
jgi:hypothetical protein